MRFKLLRGRLLGVGDRRFRSSILIKPFNTLSGLLLVTGIHLSAAAAPPGLRLIINSNQDTIQPDDGLTLREAISLANGTLSPAQLSAAEKAQVIDLQGSMIHGQVRSRIEFNLPTNQTTIRLVKELPPLTAGMTIDGTTQPSYPDTQQDRIEPIPEPIVEITPAKTVEIQRGLTVVADRVTIRGLSLHGFNARHHDIKVTPPADIFVSQRLKPPTTQNPTVQPNFSLRDNGDRSPKDVVIEHNWLGVSLSGKSADFTPNVQGSRHSPSRSAFGVSVFNSTGITIRQNWIANHNGSGIITAVRAENLQITENVIERNGFAGMPDAIRLEGVIHNIQVTDNLIQQNAGSAIYLFKPDGSVRIQNNTIAENGRRFKQAAIYLMGNGHTVVHNQISYQPGPGVVVAAYPQSMGNRIQANQFTQVEGLGIDLVTQHNIEPVDYQQGDGVNPVIDSYQRRRKTGNFGVDAPRFLSPEFFVSLQDGTVQLAGVAMPDAQVEIYRVMETGSMQGPLNQPIATTTADRHGKFSITLGTLKPGERVSAIATHPQYGTSEPAVNAVIRELKNKK